MDRVEKLEQRLVATQHSINGTVDRLELLMEVIKLLFQLQYIKPQKDKEILLQRIENLIPYFHPPSKPIRQKDMDKG